MIFVANENCKIETVAPVTGGTLEIQTACSDKMFAKNKGVYAGDIDVKLSGSQFSGLDQVSDVVITIKPSKITKNKLNGNFLVGVGDVGISSTSVAFKKGKESASTVVQIKVTEAGQDKVRCN